MVMTLLIKNVKILGGDPPTGGAFPETADVFVNSDRISAIGRFPNKAAEKVIEGNGAYLSPGFIDVDTDSDHYVSLLDYPEQTDFLAQGVTTIIGGMCGSSMAPLLYGSLESLQKWGDISKVNVDWHSLKEFFAVIDRKPLAVNFGTLVGHSTIRRAIVGADLRELTKNELNVFGGVLRRAFEEGALGLSTGLSYVHSFKTPLAEIKYLAKIVQENGGVYATHLRKSGPELLESVDETIKLAKEVGVKTIISHFMPIEGSEKEYKNALAEIASLPDTLDFHFDVYPYAESILALYTFLPLWARTGGREVMLANLRDAWMRPRIEKDIPEINSEEFIVAQAPGANDFLVGKTLQELIDMYGVNDYREALVSLMLVTELKGTVFYRNVNSTLIPETIKHPRSLIASNAASFDDNQKTKALKSERATSTFTKYLSMVASNDLMSLEDAIRKITRVPAKKFGFASRGVIKEGNIADLTVFSIRDAAAGHGKKEVEIKCTIVNGAVAWQGSGFEGAFMGRTLKHGA